MIATYRTHFYNVCSLYNLYSLYSDQFSDIHAKVFQDFNLCKLKWGEMEQSSGFAFTVLSFFSAVNYSHFLGVWREFKIRNKFFPTTKCFTTLENTLNAAAAAAITWCMLQFIMFKAIYSTVFAKCFKWFSFCARRERNTLMKNAATIQLSHKSRHTKCLIIMVKTKAERVRTKRFNRTKSNETMIEQNFQWL